MEHKLILPTPEQVEWADAEIGVIIHLDLVTFCAPYNVCEHFCDPIPPSAFNPARLDTDQWIAAAKSLGAKYAVLVAKHGTGFSLWPTEAHEYSVKNSPYKDGKGDVVAEFIASCEKYGLRPGLYCSASFNQYFNVENPGRVRDNDPEKQARYNEIVQKQLTELWSRYGRLFEIWFDGGVLPVSEGGPDVAALLHRLQPNAVVFQGPAGTRSLLRWVGNERGEAPEDCSALFGDEPQSETGTVERGDMAGGTGEIWAPAESDFPNRNARTSYLGGWFWREGEEASILPPEQLYSAYLTSVGRNTNMLVGMVIDTNGEFPAADAAVFAEAGERIRRVFGTPLARADAGAYTVSLPETETRRAGYLAMGEDIRQGERVTGYTVRAFDGAGNTVFTHSGRVIGHKRILALPPEAVRAELSVTDSRAEPKISFLALYPAEDS